MHNKTRKTYSFEVKREVVTRALADEKHIDLAGEFAMSSSKQVSK